VYIVLDSMYETMSISTGLYPNLDLWNANKLRYITLCWIIVSRCIQLHYFNPVMTPSFIFDLIVFLTWFSTYTHICMM